MKKINLIKLLQSISRQKWVEAKSYAKIAPHEYIVDHQNYYIFNAMKWLIRYYGFYADFKIQKTVKQYRYFVLGKCRYWILGNILNRCDEKNISKEES